MKQTLFFIKNQTRIVEILLIIGIILLVILLTVGFIEGIIDSINKHSQVVQRYHDYVAGKKSK